MRALIKAFAAVAALVLLGLLTHDLWFRLALADGGPTTASRAGALSASLAVQGRLDDIFAQTDGAPTELTDQLAFDMLRHEPLNARSLIYRALSFEADGEHDSARAAMDMAAQRDPRNLALLKWRSMNAATAGDIETVLSSLAKLFELDHHNGEVYLQALESVSLSEDASAVLAEWVAQSDSPAIPRLVSELNASHSDLALLFELNIAAPQSQAAFLNRLIEAQQFDLAYLAWLQFLPPSALADLEIPYDGGFKGKEGERPFNWAIRSSQAELLPDGGLTVTHFGRNTLRFASQMIRLSPGEYDLSVLASGRTEARGSYFQWEIRCLPDERLVSSLPLEETTETLQPFDLTFSVPADACRFQRLQLVGVAGEYPRWSRLTTQRVDIVGRAAISGSEP